jgi:hypothetical protein
MRLAPTTTLLWLKLRQILIAGDELDRTAAEQSHCVAHRGVVSILPIDETEQDTGIQQIPLSRGHYKYRSVRMASTTEAR